jgi:hypothetical protein
VATGAVEGLGVVAGDGEEVLAPADEPVVEPVGGVGLPGRLHDPVQRDADGQDEEGEQAPRERPVEPGSLQGLVVVVRLAVGGELELGAELGLAREDDVDQDVDDRRHQDDGEERQPDRPVDGRERRSGGEGHGGGWCS